MSETASPLGGEEPESGADHSGAAPARAAEGIAAAAKARRRLVRKHRALRRGRKRGALSVLLAVGLVVVSLGLAALAAYTYWNQPTTNRDVVAPAGTFVAPLAREMRDAMPTVHRPG